MIGKKPLGQRTQMINSLGFVLFGYDQGVMSGIITAPAFNDLFTATKENSTMQGFVTAIYEIGTTLPSLNLSNIPLHVCKFYAIEDNAMSLRNLTWRRTLPDGCDLPSLDWAASNEDNAHLRCHLCSELKTASAETVFYFVNFVMLGS